MAETKITEELKKIEEEIKNTENIVTLSMIKGQLRSSYIEKTYINISEQEIKKAKELNLKAQEKIEELNKKKTNKVNKEQEETKIEEQIDEEVWDDIINGEYEGNSSEQQSKAENESKVENKENIKPENLEKYKKDLEDRFSTANSKEEYRKISDEAFTIYNFFERNSEKVYNKETVNNLLQLSSAAEANYNKLEQEERENRQQQESTKKRNKEINDKKFIETLKEYNETKSMKDHLKRVRTIKNLRKKAEDVKESTENAGNNYRTNKQKREEIKNVKKQYNVLVEKLKSKYEEEVKKISDRIDEAEEKEVKETVELKKAKKELSKYKNSKEYKKFNAEIRSLSKKRDKAWKIKNMEEYEKLDTEIKEKIEKTTEMQKYNSLTTKVKNHEKEMNDARQEQTNADKELESLAEKYSNKIDYVNKRENKEIGKKKNEMIKQNIFTKTIGSIMNRIQGNKKADKNILKPLKATIAAIGSIPGAVVGLGDNIVYELKKSMVKKMEKNNELIENLAQELGINVEEYKQEKSNTKKKNQEVEIAD